MEGVSVLALFVAVLVAAWQYRVTQELRAIHDVLDRILRDRPPPYDQDDEGSGNGGT